MQQSETMTPHITAARAIRAGLAACAAGWLGMATAALPVAPLVCVVSAQAVNFGNYSTRNLAPTEGTGNIQVACSGAVGQSVSYSIQLSSGTSGSFLTRRMGGGAGTLNYNLYVDPTRTAVWGDGGAGSTTISDSYVLTAVTNNRNYPVYGRLAAGQNAAIGSYVDSITVTVNF